LDLDKIIRKKIEIRDPITIILKNLNGLIEKSLNNKFIQKIWKVFFVKVNKIIKKVNLWLYWKYFLLNYENTTLNSLDLFFYNKNN